MSRVQVVIVFFLGVAVACVFGCIALFLLVPDLRPSLKRDTTAFVATVPPPTAAAAAPSPHVLPTEVPPITDLPASTPTAYPSFNATVIAQTRTAPTLTPSRAPSQNVTFQVNHYESYTVLNTYLYFVGDATNQSDVTACCTEIVLSLLDEKGNVLETSSSNDLDECQVAPHGKYPFLMEVSDRPVKYASVKFQIQSREGPSIIPCYTAFKVDKVTAHAPTNGIGQFGFTGQVINTGDKTAGLVKIILLGYDAQNNLVDGGYTFSKLSDIAPGGDSPFSVEFHHIAKPPARHEIWVEAIALND